MAPAANAPASRPSTTKPAQPAEPLLMTPEREAAALQFVRDHHPELVDLLKSLKASHSDQYQSALRQLFQTSERLAKIYETDPQRYQLELKLWKIKSRIQLLAAKASMSRDPELESQLKAALAEQAQVQLQELQMDRDRLAARLKKLDASVDQFQVGQQQTIERQLAALMRDIDRQRAQSFAKPKPSVKPAKPTNSANSTPTQASP